MFNWTNFILCTLIIIEVILILCLINKIAEKQKSKQKICKNCGHHLDWHTRNITDTHRFNYWDECNKAVMEGKAIFVCNCRKYEEE